MRNFLNDKFIKDSFIYVIGTFLTGFLGYAFHFAVSRKLSVGQYGELQSLMSLFYISGIFGTALSYFVIKYTAVFAKFKDYAANAEFFKSTRPKINIAAIALFLLFILVAPLLRALLNLSDIFGLFSLGLSMSLGVIAVIYSGILSGWQEFFDFNLTAVLGALVKLAVGFLIVLFLPSASAVAFSFAAAAIVGWGLSKYFAGRRVLSKEHYSVSPAELESKEITWQEKYFSGIDVKKSLWPVFVFTLFYILLGNIDIILVKNLTSAEITGYYGALSLLGKIILWVNLAVVAVVLPRACAAAKGGEKIGRKLFFGAYGLIILVSLSGMAFYYVFPKIIISSLFGAKYAIFINDLWLFALMAFVFSLVSLEANFSYAKHDFRVSYILAISVILMASGIYFFHQSIREIIIAVVISFFVGYIGIFFLNLFSKKSNSNIEFSKGILHSP